MPDCYDAIIIGAGHNGLTCACYLAKAGLKVLVLEQYDVIGGMSTTEELAAPGYFSDFHASGYLVAKLTAAHDELNLAEHGLKLITPNPNWAQVFPDGRSLLIFRELDATLDSIGQFSRRDANTWRRLYQTYLADKPAIVAGMNNPPPPFGEEIAKPGADAAYRFRMQSARSWVEETFESEEVRAFMASAALHAALSPDDALGGQFAWVFVCAIQEVGVSIVEGGMQRLPEALSAVLKSHGGEIRTGAHVTGVEVENGRATGVRLQTGERIAVRRVVAANVDPRHLALDLLGSDHIGQDVAERARQYEWGAPFFGVYAALSTPIEYKAGKLPGQAGYVHACHPSVDAIARSFAEVRAGLLPAAPMLGIINEAGIDPSRAPAGKGLMKFVAHFVPYRLRGDAAGRIRGSDWDGAKDAYADALVQWAAEFLPDLPSRLTSLSIQSPVDFERRTSSSVEGTHQHGAYLPYQTGALRPFPGMGGYRSPINNVYLCGAGSHPGSGITMAPGRNSARLICADLGISIAV